MLIEKHDRNPVPRDVHNTLFSFNTKHSHIRRRFLMPLLGLLSR